MPSTELMPDARIRACSAHRALPEAQGIPFSRLFSVHDVLDEDRRPLGEHRARRDLPGAAPTYLKQCPYPGGRYKHALPMNASALRQSARHQKEVLAGAAYLRTVLYQRAPVLTLPQQWRLLLAAAVLPSYLLHRASSAPARLLPGHVAALYKASLGVKYMLERHLLEKLLADDAFDTPADANDLAALSEASGVLVGLEQVCAAPAGMISDVLHAFVSADPHDMSSSSLARLVGPTDAFHAFVRAAGALYGVLLVFATLAARVQIAFERYFSDKTALATNRASGPPVAGMSAEMSMSFTLGMRRLSWPLARLPRPRCIALLKNWALAMDEVAAQSPAVQLLAELDSTAAEPHRSALARRLSRRLMPRMHASSAHARFVACGLLACYFHLAKAVRARLRDIDPRLNRALGREPSGESAVRIPSGFCAVAIWQTATRLAGGDIGGTSNAPCASIHDGRYGTR